eukprot:CAMPEP_0118880594 /NCGR_PEP_ID=MMETSP1163-20130328/20146_1 /TAXON_ID=124430 /ORGANISM="Phaeomonas parva, Strain CCMP2877" /LENGTH=330 /DNA_ID=CAMNT_0006817061 /DNA_START=144 /DNA_END=1136 /DNA_ORIENTATION=+
MYLQAQARRRKGEKPKTQRLIQEMQYSDYKHERAAYNVMRDRELKRQTAMMATRRKEEARARAYYLQMEKAQRNHQKYYEWLDKTGHVPESVHTTTPNHLLDRMQPQTSKVYYEAIGGIWERKPNPKLNPIQPQDGSKSVFLRDDDFSVNSNNMPSEATLAAMRVQAFRDRATSAARAERMLGAPNPIFYRRNDSYLSPKLSPNPNPNSYPSPNLTGRDLDPIPNPMPSPSPQPRLAPLEALPTSPNPNPSLNPNPKPRRKPRAQPKALAGSMSLSLLESPEPSPKPRPKLAKLTSIERIPDYSERLKQMYFTGVARRVYFDEPIHKPQL